MKKINTKATLTNLDGKEYEDKGEKLTLGTALVAILDAAKIQGRYKIISIIEKLHTQDEVQLDDADFSIVKKAVEETQMFASNIFVGSILKALDAETE